MQSEIIQRRVLLPIDSSNHSERAFDWYLDNMHREGDELIFLHVVAPMTSAASHLTIGLESLSEASDVITESIRNQVKQAKQLEEIYKSKAESRGVASKAIIQLDNQPGQAIVQAVSQFNVQSVVMGNRGLGAIRRTFLGSVSDYVLHHCHVPMAIIPPGKSPSA